MKRTKQDLSVPVGYRFHPTEEELLNHYLKNKIHGGNDSQIIAEIDLCKYEPTDLPDTREWGDAKRSDGLPCILDCEENCTKPIANIGKVAVTEM